MQIEILPDSAAVALRAANLIAEEARRAVAARGSFSLAVSGGTTPWQMLRELAQQEVPWPSVQVLQVDERIAPAGSDERNLTHLQASLAGSNLPPSNLHPMPVNAQDLLAAAADYTATLTKLAGTPPVLDLVHLGLGADGHTASLVPGDASLEEDVADVSITGFYQGRQRMTLTYPVINRARRILWVLTGAGKHEMLVRLQAGDETIPAGRVSRRQAIILADEAAVKGD